MKKTIYICTSVLILLLVYGCSTTDSNGDESGNDSDTASYSLTASASPSEGGTVNPSSGSYEDGRNVSVTATANEGWDFVNWTGDRESTDNPLEFKISSNTIVTANFADLRSVYSVDLTVADLDDEINLEIGQSKDEDFIYAPPPPPLGSLDARFLADGEDYYALFNSNLLREVSWELVYQSGNGDVLTLSWQITDTQMEGVLTLSDSEDPAQPDQLEIDMQLENEAQINVIDTDRVFIHYRLD
ncbi:InlB B-repeat-containing protein [Rhodohalobacter barkolensis]|uniref:Bacterial repeat domain-containing protein n=1 Tax=Rhodohalobacter barkolensis TaxID=2053187 RepID=A0A2N0VKN4_9BACT|nr:hypothetical protein [Rhodohalobacter barkolensis]PKD44763.1 hypothetical protein CWD77_04680 [Rhodohalobacter barkolensis]